MIFVLIILLLLAIGGGVWIHPLLFLIAVLALLLLFADHRRVP